MNHKHIADGVARLRRHSADAVEDAGARRSTAPALAGARGRSAATSIVRAQKRYFLETGERVPSAATVINRFKDAHGLIHWAWRLGKEGKDYREERDNAADAGTLARAAVAAWAQGRPVSFAGEKGVRRGAKRGFTAFAAWADQARFEVTHADVSLVSAQHRFGGTFGAVLVRGARGIADWKAASALYPEHLIELAAYGRLWHEAHPLEPIDAGYFLLRFDRARGELEVHCWPELDRAWEAFLHLRELYELDKELKTSVAQGRPVG